MTSKYPIIYAIEIDGLKFTTVYSIISAILTFNALKHLSLLSVRSI